VNSAPPAALSRRTPRRLRQGGILWQRHSPGQDRPQQEGCRRPPPPGPSPSVPANRVVERGDSAAAAVVLEWR